MGSSALIFELNLSIIMTVLSLGLLFVVLTRLTHIILRSYLKKSKKSSLAKHIYTYVKVMIPLLFLIFYVGVTVYVLRIYFGVDLDQTAKKSFFSKYADSLETAYESLILLWVAFFIIRAISGFQSYITELSKSGQSASMDVEMVQLVCRSIQVITFVFLGIGILGVFGQNITSLLAVSGVGTIILGLAAQSTLANFFGGFFLITDRPFVEGQWIRSPDRKIEGVVEVIGWRMTKIRTFMKTVIYVPNSIFSTILIENVSRMTHRRIQETLTVRYDDAAKLKNLLESVRTFIDQDPDIDQNMFKCTSFNAMASSSLNIKFTCFTTQCNTVLFNAIKDRILLSMIDIVHSHGCDFAFPTQTLHVPALESKDVDIS